MDVRSKQQQELVKGILFYVILLLWSHYNTLLLISERLLKIVYAVFTKAIS